MTDFYKLTKEQARQWINQRAKDCRPLPDQKELRRQLGMALVDAERKQKRNYC